MGSCQTCDRQAGPVELASIQQLCASCGFVPFYKLSYSPLTAWLGNFHPCPIRLPGAALHLPAHLQQSGELGQFGCSEAIYQALLFRHASLRRLFCAEGYPSRQAAEAAGAVGAGSGHMSFHLKRAIVQVQQSSSRQDLPEVQRVLSDLSEWSPHAASVLRELAAGADPGWLELWGDDGGAKRQRMRVALHAKFAAGQRDAEGREMLPMLLETGKAMLVEHCPKRRDSLWADGTDGTGRNWLGKLLMELRAGRRMDRFVGVGVDPDSSALDDSRGLYPAWVAQVAELHLFDGADNQRIDREHKFPDPIIEVRC